MTGVALFTLPSSGRRYTHPDAHPHLVAGFSMNIQLLHVGFPDGNSYVMEPHRFQEFRLLKTEEECFAFLAEHLETDA